jgi:DNA-directed RNA polymerase subunit RPC12/RpoP
MKKINESFVCITCERTVPAAQRTCRNHCPYCLTSLHVDGPVPGDRATDCHGIMHPVAYETRQGDQYKILFQCRRCHKKHRNKSAPDDDITGLLTIVPIETDSETSVAI